MAAASQPGLSNDNDLQTLRIHMTRLGKQYESKQQECKRLHTYHGNKCAASLQDSMKRLFEVIVYVRKADKNLIDWHYRSDRLKTVLRTVGLDKRTHVVIEKKTQKLQAKVQRVEEKFDKTGLVFDGGLQEAKRMKSDFLEFSTGNVEKVSQEVMSALDAYIQECERLDTMAKQQRAEHENAQSKADNMIKSLEVTKQSHDNAEWSKSAWMTGTIAGLGAAAVSAFLFPPSLSITGPLLVASAAAGGTAFSYSGQAEDLQTQKQSLASMLSEHDASVRVVKDKLANSTQNLNIRNKEKEEVEAFDCKNRNLLAESQRKFDELCVVQTVLDKINEKIRIMTKELHECRYEESRRGVAERLRDVMRTIQDVPKEIKSANAKHIAKAIRELTEIDEKTEEVLHIAQLSTQAQT